MRHKRILGAVAVALGAMACSGGSKKAPAEVSAKTAQPVAVTTAGVEFRKLARTVDVTGSLAADDTVSVSSEVPGRVLSVPVDFGQFVRKGDVLAELDKQEYTIQLERAKAALAQALARMGLEPSQDAVTPSSTPAIRQAQAQMEDAWSKYDNARKLVASGDISRERFEELEKAHRARLAALEAVKDDLRVQLASLQALRAEIKLVEKRLRDTTVRAPFDAFVSARMVSPGQYVKDNNPIVTLVKPWPLRLRLDVPEGAVAAVRAGSKLEFTTDAVPDKIFSATVRELNPSLDSRSRSLSAEARLTEPDARLKPGMFVQVRLTVAHSADALMVPEAALHTIAGMTKVFGVRDGKIIEYRVTPGAKQEGWVEVTGAELKPGDRVATSALPNLVHGQAVATKG